MVEFTAQQNNIEKFKELLLYRFKSSENINKLADLSGERLNGLEQLFFDSVMMFFWDNASGQQLDWLGKIIKLNRDGRNDSSYKTLLQFFIRLNMSGGTIPVFLEAISQIFNATNILYYQDFVYANPICEIYTDGEVNLFSEDDAIISSGDLLLLNRHIDQQLLTEDDQELIFENNDNFYVFSEDLTSGDQLAFTFSDSLDETILYRALPAGVGLYFLNELSTEAGVLFLTEATEEYILI
jgi:hypothetical protein